VSSDLRFLLELVKRELVKDKETGRAKITHTSTHPACKIVKDQTGIPREVPISNQESVRDHLAQTRKGNKERSVSRNNRKWLGHKHQSLAGKV
jgi:hypothetical protein